MLVALDAPKVFGTMHTGDAHRRVLDVLHAHFDPHGRVADKLVFRRRGVR